MNGPAAAFYGFYGDDFTGATDTLAHLARAGLRTMLFLRAPDDVQLALAGELDAIGIAGAARAMSPARMTDELNEVGARMASLGVRLMHYKVCSTFDSAPHIGNIGVALDTLRGYFPHPLAAIVGGQPGLQRYCVFGHLFAAGGIEHGGLPAIHRLDRHPTMSRHPVSPMRESDLRLHLRQQGLENIGLVDWRWRDAGAPALASALAAALAGQPQAVLFDVLDDAQLPELGRLLIDEAARLPLCAIGPSSIAQAYAQARTGATPPVPSSAAPITPARSPVLVLAGSLSPMTAAQIEAARSFTRIELDPAQLTGPDAPGYLDRQAATVISILHQGRHALAFTRRASEAGGPAPGAVAQACAALLRRIVAAVRVARIGVAGGDTSSFAMQALDAWGLSYLAGLPGNVALCRLHAGEARLDAVEVALKGGQMGEIGLFEQLVHGVPAANSDASRCAG